MKVGFGLYRQQLRSDNFEFACQAGATHVVAHLVDYDALKQNATRTARLKAGSGLWSEDEVVGLKRAINDHGLEFATIENFEPDTGLVTHQLTARLYSKSSSASSKRPYPPA